MVVGKMFIIYLVSVHLMQSTTKEETRNSKVDYEHFANNHGIKVCLYHVNNGQYAEKDFRESVADAGQKITYCGIDAHHQNVICRSTH